MVAKYDIHEDHIPLNKFMLTIADVGAITFTEVSGLEEELENIDLPDRTRASGGIKKAGTFKAKTPMHHVAEHTALELWFVGCQSPKSPNYKKAGLLSVFSITGNIVGTLIIAGVFPTKRSWPEFKMEDEGKMAEVEWEFSFDDLTSSVV